MERFGNMQERLFTIHQVADLLATTHREIQQWIAKGWLASRCGPDGADRVSEKALIHFLKGRGIDIMQLMVSTAVQNGSHPESPRGGPQAPGAANDRPADRKTDPSSPPAPPARDARLLDIDEETARGPRPRVLSARDGPPGPSLDEEVASALAAREMLTSEHFPADSKEPAPLPSLGLAAPREARPAALPAPQAPADVKAPAAARPAAPPTSPRPARPAASAGTPSPLPPGNVLGNPPRGPRRGGGARPSHILNEDEVAALLGTPLGAPVRSQQRPAESPDDAPSDGAEESAPVPPSSQARHEGTCSRERKDGANPMTGNGQLVPEPAHEDANGAPQAADDAGPFVGEVDEIKPDDEAGLEGRPDEQASAQAAQVLSAVLDDAVRRGATHVHLQSRQAGLTLRMRLAGRLVEKPNFRHMGTSRAKALVGRLLDLAGLAGADPARPRSGQFSHTVAGRAVRMTLSSFPTTDGPRLVISLPSRPRERLDLAALGARPEEAERIHSLLATRRGGMLLVCGPARDDRDGVLGALAGQLAGMGRDVLTIGAGPRGAADGDSQPNASTSVVDPVAGYRFRDAARHLAGQDAEAIVLAELRDPPTAAAALEAALAGATLVAGIAAETAAEALGILAEMGVESWPLATMLRGAIVCRSLPRLPGPRDRGRHNATIMLISLVEPSRELLRLVRAAAGADAIAAAVPEAGAAPLLDLAAGAVRDGNLSADDAARLS
jgi:hypothetical protein